MRRLAIIPARGGSKRIPRKNIKPFLGKPIIAYAIDAALQSGCFDEVTVSTDDAEIAEVAKSLGAGVPFHRSAELSGDHATTADVLLDVLLAYGSQARAFDQVCCIYPTAAFVTPEMLKKALDTMTKTKADACVPVYPTPTWRAFEIKDGKLNRLWPEFAATRTQDLEPTYHDAGMFYWFTVKSFMDEQRIITANTVPMVLSPMEVQDIDTPEDWSLAEAKHQAARR